MNWETVIGWSGLITFFIAGQFFLRHVLNKAGRLTPNRKRRDKVSKNEDIKIAVLTIIFFVMFTKAGWEIINHLSGWEISNYIGAGFVLVGSFLILTLVLLVKIPEILSKKDDEQEEIEGLS